ncbi:MAG: M23 family metallopeptidase, partial [Pseudomonadota bacterium]
MRDERTLYPSQTAAGSTLKRAPLAAAAALGVLAGGAAFLAFAISRPTTPEIAPPPAAIEIASIEAAPVASGQLVPAPLEADEAPAPEISAVTVDDKLTPRLKPDAQAPAAAPTPSGASAASVLTFASAWLADEEDRPPSFFFESDLTENQSASAQHDKENGDIAAAPHDERIVLSKGETFVDALRRAGVRAEDRNEAAFAFGKLYNMRRLRPGQEFALTLAEPNRTLFQAIVEKEPPPSYLLSLDFRVDPEKRITLAKAASGGFTAKEFTTPLTTRIAAIEGRIDGSLYISAKRQGAPDEVIAGLAQMFAYDVDFQREIFGGDEFEAIFQVRFDEAGNMVGGGDILFGRLKWRGRQKEKGYYRFETADGGGKGDYFDASGESARRLLMKTPIDGARLSSGFGTRKHPILGYQKAHKGVDFAAARGTPIMAAGDGVIERAGPYGSFGNYVRIRHAQG